jgi:hypothetical protein
MVVGDNAGPLERAWLCNGFRVMEWDGAGERPEVFAPDGEVPVLMLPASCARCPHLRECAAGFAISDLYWQRYGWLALVRGIRAWDRIADDLDYSREFAAD